MRFADLLREYRLEAGLTQEDLAVKSGISRTLVGNMETGDRRPPLESLPLICVTINLIGDKKQQFIEAAHLDHATEEVRQLVRRLRLHLAQLAQKNIENEAKLALIMSQLNRLGIKLPEVSDNG